MIKTAIDDLEWKKPLWKYDEKACALYNFKNAPINFIFDVATEICLKKPRLVFHVTATPMHVSNS